MVWHNQKDCSKIVIRFGNEFEKAAREARVLSLAKCVRETYLPSCSVLFILTYEVWF